LYNTTKKMKHLFTICAALTLGFGAVAQTSIQPLGKTFTEQGALTAPGIALPANRVMALAPDIIYFDTIIPPILASRASCADTVTIYRTSASGKGYVSGNNQYGDLEKLMKYSTRRNSNVVSIFAFIGGKKNGTLNSSVFGVSYSDDGTGQPDVTTRVVSDGRPMTQIVDRRYNQFSFSDSAAVTGNFYVGVALPSGAGDTIGIYMTRIPSQARPAFCFTDSTLAWERAGDSTFLSMRSSWGRSVKTELMIQVELSFDSITTSQKDLLSDLVSVKPMPATGDFSVMLPANIKGATTWAMLSSDGRVVARSEQEEKSALVQIERGNLKAGVYTLRLQTAKGPVVKRVVFE
jgi:hypothetical protein